MVRDGEDGVVSFGYQEFCDKIQCNGLERE